MTCDCCGRDLKLGPLLYPARLLRREVHPSKVDNRLGYYIACSYDCEKKLKQGA